MTTTQIAAAAAAKIKNLRYGIEIETVGRSRRELAEAIATATGGRAHFEGGYYDKWFAVLPDGRKWTCMTDGSLSTVNDVAGGCEVVSPIMTFADDAMLQVVVRTLRAVGGRVDPSCSIHVHVDGAELNGASASRLLRLVYRREKQIFRALGTQVARQNRWCKETSSSLIQRLDAVRPTTMDALAGVWYDGNDCSYSRREHYHGSRYVGLNLHSFWYRGTVEGRWFEATLHAGKVRAYALFARALVAAAIVGETFVDADDADDASEAESFARFLDAIGLGGDDFENYREHLSAGSLSTAMRTARDSVRQYVIRLDADVAAERAAADAARVALAQAAQRETAARAATLRAEAERNAAARLAARPTTATARSVSPFAAPAAPAMRMPGDDPREPSIGETVSARGRNGRVQVTRIPGGNYRVDAARYGHEQSVGTVHGSLSGAASAACGCRTNGYALFDRGAGQPNGRGRAARY